MKNSIKLLIVEDQLDQCAVIVERLESLSRDLNISSIGADIRTNYPLAAEALKSNTYDIIIVDNHLPGGYGADLIKSSREEKVLTPETKVIILTGQPDMVRNMENENTIILTKPQGYFRLGAQIKLFLEQSLNSQSAA